MAFKSGSQLGIGRGLWPLLEAPEPQWNALGACHSSLPFLACRLRPRACCGLVPLALMGKGKEASWTTVAQGWWRFFSRIHTPEKKTALITVGSWGPAPILLLPRGPPHSPRCNRGCLPWLASRK